MLNGYLEINYYENIDKLVNDLNNELVEGDLVYLKASNGMKFDKIIELLKEKSI